MSRNEQPVRNFNGWEIFQALMFIVAICAIYGGIVLLFQGIWYVLPIGLAAFGIFFWAVMKQPKPKDQ